jgi:hypothetical protein
MVEVVLVKDEGRFPGLLGEELKTVFSAGEAVAVKLHMGDENNYTHLASGFVKGIVGVLKNLGANPFLFDSPVSYDSRRKTVQGYLGLAAEKGFSEEQIGCPVVVSDESTNVKGTKIKYGVCKALTKADGVLVLSHVKGHSCCGFGGAIKQLGMGALDAKTKQRIHDGGKPLYVGGCIMCGECAKACPLNNIRYSKSRPYFDNNWCSGCSDCIYACKQGALKPREELFDALLAEGAALALKSFKKVFFVNVLRNITKECDCLPQSEIVTEDIGLLMSRDLVAIDKASFDLINEQAGRDVFEDLHKKSAIKHIRRAARLRAGKLEYELVRR